MKKNSAFLWIVSGGLLVSLLINVILLSQLRAFYAERLLAQITPVGPPSTPRMTGETNHFAATVMLFGDSRLTVWNPAPPPGMRLVNAAIGGTTTAQLRLRLPALLDEFKPDFLVLQAGINDLKLLGLRPELEAVLIEQTKTNLLAIIQEAQCHQTKVLVLPVWPPGPPEWQRRLFWNPHVAEAVAGLNRELLTPVNKPDIRVVDLLAAAGVKPGPADYRDALHFQPAVYDRLTPALWQCLEKNFNPPPR